MIPFRNIPNKFLSRLLEGKEKISRNLNKYLLEDDQISVELGENTQNKSFSPDELSKCLSNKKN